MQIPAWVWLNPAQTQFVFFCLPHFLHWLLPLTSKCLNLIKVEFCILLKLPEIKKCLNCRRKWVRPIKEISPNFYLKIWWRFFQPMTLVILFINIHGVTKEWRMILYESFAIWHDCQILISDCWQIMLFSHTLASPLPLLIILHLG